MTLPRALTIVGVLTVLAVVVLLCAFKIADTDFWWHLKAGEIMLQMRSVIGTDPFAHTRAGQPYLALHGWLSEIILFLAWHAGGPTGVILLRTFLMAGVFLLLLSIDLKRLWVHVPLAILAASVVQRGFVERPQLFTYLLFGAQLVLMLRYLDAPSDVSSARTRGPSFAPLELRTGRGVRLIMGMVGLQILWVNLHGGAAFLGLILFAALFAQKVIDIWRADRAALPEHRRELLFLLLGGLAVALTLLASPSGVGNLQYLKSLLTDRTVQFILEWAPRPFGIYLREIGPFWILALLAVLLTRRHMVFALLTLLVLGALSRQAFRHEMPFVLAALGITIEQLKGSALWHQRIDRALRWPKITVAAWVIVTVFVISVAAIRADALHRPLDLAGYGTFEPGRGAANFLEREGVGGKMFNTYDLGGYLEYRSFPDRKVFIDGRNVDFGYEFLRAYALAAQDPEAWGSFEERYDLTYAVLSHYLSADDGDIPTFDHLERNPHWSLAYLDDWTVVYLKDTEENRPIIERTRYKFLTPRGLRGGAVIDRIAQGEAPLLERELIRAIRESPESLIPRLVLARLYVAGGLKRSAKEILRDASMEWPRRYEPLELLAAIEASEQRWAEAGALYEEALARAGNRVEGVDYASLADIFERAGDSRKAERYRRKAGRQ